MVLTTVCSFHLAGLRFARNGDPTRNGFARKTRDRRLRDLKITFRENTSSSVNTLPLSRDTKRTKTESDCLTET